MRFRASTGAAPPSGQVFRAEARDQLEALQHRDRAVAEVGVMGKRGAGKDGAPHGCVKFQCPTQSGDGVCLALLRNRGNEAPGLKTGDLLAKAVVGGAATVPGEMAEGVNKHGAKPQGRILGPLGQAQPVRGRGVGRAILKARVGNEEGRAAGPNPFDHGELDSMRMRATFEERARTHSHGFICSHQLRV